MIDGTIERIRTSVPHLKPAEARIARAILADPGVAAAGTVRALAESAQTSQASVVRFAKTAGFAGFPELRLALARDESRMQVERERFGVAEGALDDGDSLAEAVAKIAFHEATSIEQTSRLVDLQGLETVASAIAAERRCVVFGVGASGLSAMDLAQKLQRIGLYCQYSQDTHVQLTHGALATDGSVAIAISFGGHTVEVHRALALARDRGAVTVAITSAPASPVGRTADHVLLTVAQESPLRIAALASRITQLAVIDFLFVRVAQLRYGSVAQALDATREAVLPQHAI